MAAVATWRNPWFPHEPPPSCLPTVQPTRGLRANESPFDPQPCTTITLTTEEATWQR